MSHSFSISGQVVDLYERGYTLDQIFLEIRSRPGQGHVSMERVKTALKQVTGRSADSRRLFEIYESVLEILSIVRDIANDAQKRRVAASVRVIEKRLTTLSQPDRTV